MRLRVCAANRIMARRPRLQFPAAVYHVMSRGNRKAAIFNDDADRRCFINVLGETVLRYRARVYAACLMDNHYHLLLDTPRNNLSAVMRQVNGVYSQTANERHSRSGHTFEARFHSVVVQWEQYLRRAARYVVLNPVKAGLCANASRWPWSTYRATAGLESPPAWLYLDWLEWAFRVDSRKEAQDRYRAYVNMRTATKTTIDWNAQAYGTNAFQKRAKELSEVHDRGRRLPPTDAAPDPLSLETLLVCDSASSERRDALIYSAHLDYGYPLAKIAEYLALNASTVGKAFRRYRRRF